MRISDRDRRIICLWLAGFKAEAIAAEMGTTRGPIHRRAGELGLPRRLPGAQAKSLPRPNLWPHIVRWARFGYSALEIAKGIGCTNPELMSEVE